MGYTSEQKAKLSVWEGKVQARKCVGCGASLRGNVTFSQDVVLLPFVGGGGIPAISFACGSCGLIHSYSADHVFKAP